MYVFCDVGKSVIWRTAGQAQRGERGTGSQCKGFYLPHDQGTSMSTRNYGFNSYSLFCL
jgi:hypothetical protein